jgi:hypothetical protein
VALRDYAVEGTAQVDGRQPVAKTRQMSHDEQGAGDVESRVAAGMQASVENDRAKHERKVLFWTKVAGIGVVVYTLVTAFILAASVYSAWTARDTEIQQLRAYVAISNGASVLVDEQKIEFPVDNFGQTPAKDARMSGQWEFTRFEEDLAADFKFPDRPQCDLAASVLGQNIAFGIITILPKNSVKALHYHCPGTWSNLQRAVQRELNAFLYGRIDYFDVFSKRRTSNFCLLWIPSQQAAFHCSRHNELDPDE